MKQFIPNLAGIFKLKIVFLVLLCALCTIPAIATTYNVTTTADGTTVNTLRGAITAADLAGGTSTINVPAGTYNLTLGLIDFGETGNVNLTISGADSATTIIDGGNLDRIFGINWQTGTVSGVKITIKNFTFRNGDAQDGYGGGAIWLGGPLNNISISACAFKTNTSNLEGGAIDMGGDGGILSIDQCSFISNTVTGGEGGAICARVVNGGGFTESGSITVTNAQFGGNKAVDGGTIYVVSAGGTGSFALSVHNNSFVGNAGTGTAGGIYLEYEQSGQTANINFNRFFNNTSGTAPSTLAVTPIAGEGVIDASNNWWGSDTPPSTAVASANANITIPNFMRLTVTSTPGSTCGAAPGDTTIVTASFLTNSLGTTLTAANVSALTGVPIIITGAIKGTLSNIQTTIQSIGTATATYVANTTGNGSVTYAIDNFSGTLPIVIGAEILPTTNQTVTQNTGINSNVYVAACQLLNKAVPSGATPISGSVTAKVWIESSVPHVATIYPFVARHYQITPLVGATTATGTLTLYFTQAEFNAYNADPNSGPLLPTGPADASGKANLRIGKYPGTSSDNSGMPSTYTTGTPIVIDPVDANIVWDATNNWWAITFDVSGFSGFIVQTSAIVLPLKLIDFTAALSNNTATLNWDVADQINVSTYFVEKSSDGFTYNNIDSIAANKLSDYSYSSVDENIYQGKNYYRLKIVDQDGTVTYSTVAFIDNDQTNNQDIIIYPNPAKDQFFIKQTGQEINNKAQLTDIDGKVLQVINITSSLQSINISSYNSGIYILHLNDGSVYKIIKQ